MKIVEFNKDRHYGKMCSFWKEYGWVPCPINALPKNGRVAETDKGKFIAFMAIYIEPGTIAIIDWALANPSIDSEESQPALRLIFYELIELAKCQGCHYIYSFTKNRIWGNRLQSYGMIAAERGATSYVLPLDGDEDVSFISD